MLPGNRQCNWHSQWKCHNHNQIATRLLAARVLHWAVWRQDQPLAYAFDAWSWVNCGMVWARRAWTVVPIPTPEPDMINSAGV